MDVLRIMLFVIAAVSFLVVAIDKSGYQSRRTQYSYSECAGGNGIMVLSRGGGMACVNKSVILEMNNNE